MSQIALFDAPQKAFVPAAKADEKQEALARLEHFLSWQHDEFELEFAHFAVILQAEGLFSILKPLTRRGDLDFYDLMWAINKLDWDGTLTEIKHYWGAEQPPIKKGDPEYRGYWTTYKLTGGAA